MTYPARGSCIPVWVLAAFIAGASLPAAAHAGSLGGIWSDLWWNRDQQGQRLLESGDAAAAARRFRDPRRQAYADLSAGRYREAAQRLVHFKDPQSQYNLGNALARAGQLPAALSAYDAALAQAPHDRDARHNRDLVARALARQSKQPQAQAQAQAQASRQQGQTGPRQDQGAQQAERGQPSQPQRQARAQPGQQPGQGQQAEQGQGQQGRGQQGQQGEPHPQQPEQLARQGGAQRSGTTGTQRAGHGPASAQSPILAQAQPAGPAQSRPESEQALSLAQWLRRLPDDPGELLRRKFLIEHLMRQQGGQ